MDPSQIVRALAIVFSRLPPQASARALPLLPSGPRQEVAKSLESAGQLSPGDLTFVEQVLSADLDALLHEAGQTDGDRLLAEVVPLQVSDLLAVLFLHATPERVAGALVHLPARLQGELLFKLSVQSPEALSRRLGRVEVEFLDEVDRLWPTPARQADTTFSTGVLASVSSPAAVRRLLTAVNRLDPECGEGIRDRVYRFGDLVRLSDLELQRLLMGVDHWDLALAMRAAGDGLYRRVNASISDRRRQYLLDDANLLQDADQEDVDTVRAAILASARRLYEEGKIATYLGSVVPRAEAPEEEAELEDGLGRRGGDDRDLKEEKDWPRAAKTAAFAVVSLSVVLWLSGIVRIPDTGGRGTGRAALRGSGGAARAGGPHHSAVRPGGADAGTRASDLVVTQGEVRAIGRETRDVQKGSELNPGEMLETGESGQAQMRLWADGGQALLEPSSALQVGGDGETRDRPPSLDLRLGRMWVWVRHPEVEVRSPLVRLTASEGTILMVRVVMDASTTVAVHRGTAWVLPLVAVDPSSRVLGPQESVRCHPDGRVVATSHDLQPGWLLPL